MRIADPPDVDGLLACIAEDPTRPSGPKNMLTVCASNARPNLRTGLEQAGWQCQALIAYDPRLVPIDVTDIWPRIAAVPLGSAATVERFLQALQPSQRQDLVLGQPSLVAMGRHTASTIQAAGVAIGGLCGRTVLYPQFYRLACRLLWRVIQASL